MNRRRLLKYGLLGAALLAVAGADLLRRPPVWTAAGLSAAAREIFAALARAVLDGALPADPQRAQQALEAHLKRLEATIAGLPPPAQQELGTLLAVLVHPLGRRSVAALAEPWATASVADLHSALSAMRTSRLALRQQAYHALRDLTSAAYFADPSTWAGIGYPGPRNL
jgi:hypothetical protein